MQVLAADGETVIGNLYAVGNDSCGVLYTDKKPYVTYGGAALGWGHIPPADWPAAMRCRTRLSKNRFII